MQEDPAAQDMHQDTYQGTYLTWELDHEAREGARRPVDGWASWVMSNLWRALFPLLVAAGALLLAVVALAASLAPAWLFWVTANLDLLLGCGLGLSLLYWLALMRAHPFLDSPRPSALDLRWWPRVAPLLPPETRAALVEHVPVQRWRQIPITLTLTLTPNHARLSWAPHLAEASPLPNTPLPRADARSRPSPPFKGGAVELHPGAFALELLRAPAASEPLTVYIRSTRRRVGVALLLGALEPGDEALPLLERPRVQLAPRDRAALLRRLLQHARESDDAHLPQVDARVLAATERAK